MSEQTVKKTAANSVEIEGFLKENMLQRNVSQDGRDYISGYICLALSEEEDYRIRFLAFRTNSNGSENRHYATLEALLPTRTTSIATLLKSNEGATFNEVKWSSTKVWARAQFDSFDKKDVQNNIHSTITLRGITAGIKEEHSKNPFTTKAKFNVEGYVESIKPEKNSLNDETGRMIVNLIIPDYYTNIALPIDFICESPNAVESIGGYHKGDSGRFVGSLRNARQEIKIKGETIKYMDGSEEDTSRITYSFVNERIIEKMIYPYTEDNAKYISFETIKEMMANRQDKLDNLSISPDKSVSAAKPSSSNNYKGFEI